jgi:hypothetical protein
MKEAREKEKRFSLRNDRCLFAEAKDFFPDFFPPGRFGWSGKNRERAETSEAV